MNTKDFQHNVLQLMKGKEVDASTEDAYFEYLKSSIDLEIMKDISAWWRCVTIEKYCVLTSRLLSMTGDFEKQIRAFYQHESISPFVEIASHQFLHYIMHQSTNPLWVSVADFEDKLIKVRKGDELEYSIQWNYEPYSVIGKLVQNQAFSETQLSKGLFETRISNDIEDYFNVFPMN